MQDRNVEFPNRFRMVKVEGTDDIYDMIPAPGDVLNPGTLLNKANLLTDETAAALGLESEDPTVNGAFVQLNRNVIEKPAFQKIASYEVAGSYQWTAPDLADGKAYKIGVLAIGGGGSGGIAQTATGSSAQQATGGASGYTRAIVLEVAPGDTKSLVVGAGGKAKTASMVSGGLTGGTSSFDGVTADGGSGGGGGASSVPSSNGGQGNSGTQYGEYGRISHANRDCSNPSCCFNPFEGTDILGAGGSVWQYKNNGNIEVYKGGKNPLTNKGGGDGINGTVGNPATEPGCGGGAVAYATSGANRTSGAGADGAVYIYFLGVVDE